MRNPRDFFKPLAMGAPDPVAEIPVLPGRMIHFLDFSNEKMVAKVPDIAPTVDILLANLEDGVPADQKEAARAGLVEVSRRGLGPRFWYGSPWAATRVITARRPSERA